MQQENITGHSAPLLILPAISSLPLPFVPHSLPPSLSLLHFFSPSLPLFLPSFFEKGIVNMGTSYI